MKDFDYSIFKEMRLKKREALEPGRKIEAKVQLEKIKYNILKWDDYNRCWEFYGKYRGKIWPHTGWFAVKGIGTGRGLKNLIEKLKNE